MIYRSYDTDQNKFLSLHETGMGYQVIDAKRYGKTSKDRFVVFNSELIVDLDNRFQEFKRYILIEGYSKILNEFESLAIDTNTISLVPRSELTETRILTDREREDKGRHSDGKGAIENPSRLADGKEIFVRLSAYKNDKRIDFENKKLRDGTYTTTEVDYKTCVRLRDDPIDRYALPSDDEIEWAFYIRPQESDILQRGIVQPAFGHYGGGLEIYFKYGTSDNTYLYTRPYGT